MPIIAHPDIGGQPLARLPRSQRAAIASAFSAAIAAGETTPSGVTRWAERLLVARYERVPTRPRDVVARQRARAALDALAANADEARELAATLLAEAGSGAER